MTTTTTRHQGARKWKIRLLGNGFRSIELCPLLSGFDGEGLVGLPLGGDVVVERVIGVGGLEEELDGETDLVDLERGRPLVLEDIEADTAETINVGVVNLSEEADFGRDHGVVLGQEKLELEHAALVRRLGRTGDHNVEVSEVVCVRLGADTRNGVLHHTLSLLDDTTR